VRLAHADLRALDASKPLSRGGCGITRGHVCCEIPPCSFVEIELDFLIELSLEGRRSKQIEDASENRHDQARLPDEGGNRVRTKARPRRQGQSCASDYTVTPRPRPRYFGDEEIAAAALRHRFDHHLVSVSAICQ
jgi:hypothetical protein